MEGFNLGSIFAQIKADTSDFKKGIRDAQREAGNFGSTMATIGSGIVDFGKQAAVMTGVVGAGLAIATKFGLDAAGKFEQYQIAYTTLLGSQQKAADAIKNIQKDAAATPFEMAPLVMANQRLISAGISAGQARKDILNLGDAISATGGGNAELERLSTNLQQIKAVGKASALDIKQFAFAGINVYDMLAKSTGKSVAEVKDMDVSYAVLSKSFELAAGKGGLFHDAMKNQSTTLNGLISTLHDTVSIGLKDLLINSGVFDLIKDGVNSAIPAIQNAVPIIVGFVTDVSDAIKGMVEIITGHDMGLLAEVFADWGVAPETGQQIISMLKGLGDAFQVVSDWVSQNQALVITFLQGLAIALGTLLVIGTITALVTALMNPLVLVGLAIALLFTAWQTNFLGIQGITAEVFSYIQFFITNIVMPVIGLLTEWVRSHWFEIQTITQGVFNIVVGLFQWAFATVWAIVAIAAGLLTGKWDEVGKQLEKASKMADEAVTRIFSGLAQTLLGIGAAILQALVSPFEGAWKQIEGFMIKIRDAVDFTKRHSPSVIDLIDRGVSLANRAYENLDMPITPMSAAMASGPGVLGGGGMSTVINVDLTGAIISDEFGAERMAERIGDSLMQKLKTNIRI
jgi:tape measure domain-containing protein